MPCLIWSNPLKQFWCKRMLKPFQIIYSAFNLYLTQSKAIINDFSLNKFHKVVLINKVVLLVRVSLSHPQRELTYFVPYVSSFPSFLAILKSIPPLQHGLWNSLEALHNVKAKAMLKLVSGLISLWLTLDRMVPYFLKNWILDYTQKLPF